MLEQIIAEALQDRYRDTLSHIHRVMPDMPHPEQMLTTFAETGKVVAAAIREKLKPCELVYDTGCDFAHRCSVHPAEATCFCPYDPRLNL